MTAAEDLAQSLLTKWREQKADSKAPGNNASKAREHSSWSQREKKRAQKAAERLARLERLQNAA